MADHAPTPLDLEHLRRWEGRTESASDTVTPWLAAAFRATFQLDPVAEGAITGEARAPAHGEPTPLGLHWCLAAPTAPTERLGPDGHPARGGFLPPVPLPRRMWAGGRISFHDELRVGDTVERRSTVKAVAHKHGRAGPLIFVVVEHEFTTGRGLALREEHDIVYRDVSGEPAEDHPQLSEALPAAAVRRTIEPRPTLLFRYSALTFNSHRIHYDRDYVTSVEGYPGLLVHGPLQATLLMELATEILGERLAAFSFRAERPLFDLAPFTIEGSRAEAGADLRARDAQGRVTMRAAAMIR